MRGILLFHFFTINNKKQMDVIAAALLISVICNAVQIVFYLTRLYRDYRQHQKEIEIQRQKRTYCDLKEEDGPIYF